MGKAVTAFKDIGKACSDLLSKDYTVGKNTVEVKSKTPNGVTFTPKGTASDGKFSGSLQGKYGFPKGIDGEATINTTGVLSAQTEVSGLAKGLTMTFNCDTPAAGKPGMLSAAKCKVDYKNESVTCTSTYDYYKSELSTALSTAYQAVTMGCSFDYSMAKTSLTKYAMATQYVQPDYSVAAKIAETVGKGGQTFTGSYYHKVSGDMQVGGEVSKAMSKPDVNLSFGCAFKLDKDTAVKAKVDSDGILYGSYKQKMSPLTTMTLAAQVDTVNLSENKHKLGMVLNLTP